MPMLRHIRH